MTVVYPHIYVDELPCELEHPQRLHADTAPHSLVPIFVESTPRDKQLHIIYRGQVSKHYNTSVLTLVNFLFSLRVVSSPVGTSCIECSAQPVIWLRITQGYFSPCNSGSLSWQQWRRYGHGSNCSNVSFLPPHPLCPVDINTYYSNIKSEPILPSPTICHSNSQDTILQVPFV